MKAQNNSPRSASYGPNGNGAEIVYTTIDSALGRLLVAGTQHGICFAGIGEADPALVAALRGLHPGGGVGGGPPQPPPRRAHRPVGRCARGVPRRPREDAHAADGYSRHTISVRGVGATARDSHRRNALVFRNRAADRTTARRARGRYRQRRESDFDYHPMSSRDSRVGASRRLSMGAGAETEVA
jgi:hypothetical protein